MLDNISGPAKDPNQRILGKHGSGQLFLASGSALEQLRLSRLMCGRSMTFRINGEMFFGGYAPRDLMR